MYPKNSAFHDKIFVQRYSNIVDILLLLSFFGTIFYNLIYFILLVSFFSTIFYNLIYLVYCDDDDAINKIQKQLIVIV